MTPAELELERHVRHLAGRLQRVYDALGSQSRVQWSLQDATAVRALLELEKTLRANGGDRDPLQGTTTRVRQ